MSLEAGSTLAHYTLVEKIGEGGMGVVWRAHDAKLDRDVALKVLPERVAGRAERLSRFRREAKALAALSHPNIVTVHSVEEADGVHFLTMELIEGETLDATLAQGPLSLDAFFDVALPLVDALGAAHAGGIVHRDVKPANLMRTTDGRVKVLDFGLSRVAQEASSDDAAPTVTSTQAGVVMGTPAYMAPEQAEGKPVDERADLFSAGALFFEALTGRRPFERGSTAGTLAAVLHQPPDADALGALPTDLAAIVARCLQKDPGRRYAGAAELRAALDAARGGRQGPAAGRPRRRALLFGGLVLVAVAATVVGVLVGRGGGTQGRVYGELLPRVEQAIDEARMFDAYRLAREAWELLPADPVVASVLERTSLAGNIDSDPPGASVRIQSYREPSDDWIELGSTPLAGVRVPTGYLRMRIDKEGHEPRLLAASAFAGTLRVKLDPLGSPFREMSHVPADSFAAGRNEPLPLPAYRIDTHEVSNREFKAFVDAGGYSERSHWPHPIVAGGRELSWEEARARFVDATGRPGPATWEFGEYPDGTADHPVRGVSWYEAAAYAEWAGKELPTIYHWRHAAGITPFADIIALSNFQSDGPAPVGRHQGLSPYGALDMAGNVKEWCSTRLGDQRYILGGAWDEAHYVFGDNDARDPIERAPNFGFRCVRYEEPPPPEALSPVTTLRYDFAAVEPVSDELFEVFASLYDYPDGPLDVRIEARDESPRHWIRETVSFAPGYEGPRMLVHLFFPRDAEPPYSTVVLRPGAAVNFMTTLEEWAPIMPSYLPRSGRLMALPVYFGTLERRAPDQGAVRSSGRERLTRQVMDLRRAVDYLLTREDVRADTLAYVGISAGAEYGAPYLALERRLKTAVLIGGGFHDEHMLGEPREINPWHYAPRVTLPLLMINGEHDFTVPVETAQKPMFDLLGTPPDLKRHVILPGGHVSSDPTAVIRETLAWLDAHQGTPD